MKQFYTLLFISFSQLLIGQVRGTTDDGKRVVLNSDGTWEYLQNEVQGETTYVYLGTERLEAGKPEVVNEGGAFSPSTSFQLAKQNDRMILLVWQEQPRSFNNEVWQGDVILFLENAEAIRLVDRNMTGMNILKDGYTSKSGLGISMKSDLHQRYSAYYLTKTECRKLEATNTSAITYSVGSKFMQPSSNATKETLQIDLNPATLKRQLKALK